MNEQASIGVIGLGVMGQNLALNFANHKFAVSVWDREPEVINQFISGNAKGKKIVGSECLHAFTRSLSLPRKILLMVKAGKPVDMLIEQLLPHMDKGDIIIDGGNSHYEDSNRRYQNLSQQGMHFIGAGISGGEEGALNGPSLMPGGSESAWRHVQPLFQSIAAEMENEPCCAWIGPGGSGHFVKMVHNGIEYGDMQLICEAYHVMKDVLAMNYDEMQRVFAGWNQGPLASYLIEITAEILGTKEDSAPLLEKILDTAGQKGTGKWTGISAMKLGIPLTLITEAVFSRCLSARKDERVNAAQRLTGPKIQVPEKRSAHLVNLEQALLAARMISYAQGFSLLREAAAQYSWDLDYAQIARLWRGGCIIRSAFLNDISAAFKTKPKLENLLLAEHFQAVLEQCQSGWRETVILAINSGIPCPALSAGLNYYDGLRSARLPANLLQAQRDYFGAHNYDRTDRPRVNFFHTEWKKQSAKHS